MTANRAHVEVEDGLRRHYRTMEPGPAPLGLRVAIDRIPGTVTRASGLTLGRLAITQPRFLEWEPAAAATTVCGRGHGSDREQRCERRHRRDREPSRCLAHARPPVSGGNAVRPVSNPSSRCLEAGKPRARRV